MRDDALIHGSTFLVTDPDGRATREHDGFFAGDTRQLDRYALDVRGRALEPLANAAPRPGERVHTACDSADGARTLAVVRRQVVAADLCERIRVRNLTAEPRSETLELALGARFDDLFEVRGYADGTRTRTVGVETAERRATFRYDPDAVDRTWRTTVTADRGRVRGARSGDGRADATLELPFELGPHEAADAVVAVVPDGTAVDVDPAAAFAATREAVVDRERRWRETTAPPDAPTDAWRAALATGRDDLLELLLETDHGRVFAAGVPWYATAFGRDSVIAAAQALPLTTAPAVGTCRYLAAQQATAVDEFRDAEPGKIMHEIRHGELTVRGETPHSPYYGTIDATALFVVLVHETWRWTGDDEFAADLWPAVERALGWLDEYGDGDGDGFLEYPTDPESDLRHRAWKDSPDGIVHPDGSDPEGPLAVEEAQGYYADAKRRAAELARSVVGDEAAAERLAAEGDEIATAFDEAFWLPEETFYAVALDGANDPVAAVGSNPGHCLWSGVVPPERADAVIDRLVADDMFSGWGVRTLSADHAGYNPQSYHRGSVWPHDNSLIALGAARYGRGDAARRIADGLVEAAASRESGRLPELFAGFDRAETEVPVPYGTACEPQAWAAAAPFALARAVGAADEPGDRR